MVLRGLWVRGARELGQLHMYFVGVHLSSVITGQVT